MGKPRAFCGRAQEFVGVLRHAQRVGADHAHRLAGHAGQALGEAAQRGDGALLRVVVEAPVGPEPGAQADRFLDRVERVDLVVDDAADREVEAVGAEVDRGEGGIFHAGVARAPSRLSLGEYGTDPGPPAPLPGRHESFTKPHQTLGYQAEDRLPPGEPTSPRALPEPRAAGAGIQPARARAGRGQGHAAPGAPALRLHRLVQHGRVLRDPRGGPEGAAEARRRRHRARRPHAARDLLARDGHRPRPHRAPVRDPQRGDPAGPRRRRASASCAAACGRPPSRSGRAISSSAR